MEPESGVRSSTPILRLQPFVLDTVKRVLLRDGSIVPLTSRALDTLLALIRHRDQVLEKDDLLKEVWRGTIVEENNLARNISTLRKALDETPDAHRYIVTVPGRGYRFVAEVEERQQDERPVPDAGGPSAVRRTGRRAECRRGRAARRPELYRTWRLPPALAVLAALAYIGVMFWTAVPPVAASTAAPRTMWQLTFDSGVQAEPTWSPDGRMIAYSSDRSGNVDLWVQPVDGGNPVQVTTGSAFDVQPDWSPDGRHLAFRTGSEGGGIVVVPALGGNEQRVSDFGEFPQWSPDSRQILFWRSTINKPELYTVGLDGEAPRRVLQDFADQFTSLKVAWHPDGRRVSIWGLHRRAGISLWTVGVDGGMPVQSVMDAAVRARFDEGAVSFVNADGFPTMFRWAPRGDALYFEGASHGVNNLWKVQVDAATLRWTSGPDRLTTAPNLNADLALRTDGKRLAFAARTERIRLWSFPFDPAAGRLTGPGQPITSGAIDALSPDISPDGRRVVYKKERSGTQELWEQSLETGIETQIVKGDRLSRRIPRWDRDSRRLFYARAEGRAIDNQIVSLEVPGGEEQVVPHLSEALDLVFDQTRDGRWVLGGTRGAEGWYSLVFAFSAPDARGGAQSRTLVSMPGRHAWQARMSTDQRWVAFSAAQAGHSSVYVVASDGGEWTAITDGHGFDDRPQWSPDGRMLYFLSTRTGSFNLWGRRFDPDRGMPVGDAFQVTTFHGPARAIPNRMVQLGVALGADRLILPISDVSSNIWVLEGVDR